MPFAFMLPLHVTGGCQVHWGAPECHVPYVLCMWLSRVRYTGFCALGAMWQALESSDHKAALQMPDSLSGIYITAVEPCYPAAQVGAHA